MKEIALPKPKLEMGDDGVTPSQDLVDAKIFEYQICKYVNQFTIMSNRLKAAYYLRLGQCSK